MMLGTKSHPANNPIHPSRELLTRLLFGGLPYLRLGEDFWYQPCEEEEIELLCAIVRMN